MLLHQYSSDELMNFACFPKVQPVLQATPGSDIDTERPRIGDHCWFPQGSPRSCIPGQATQLRDGQCRGSTEIGDQPVRFGNKQRPELASSEVGCHPRAWRKWLRVVWRLGRMSHAGSLLMAKLSTSRSRCPLCNGCSDCPAAIEWYHRIRRLLDRAVEAGPRFLETAADLHVSVPCGSQDQNLCFQCRPLDQNHTEHSEGVPVVVVLAAEWVFENWGWDSASGLRCRSI